MANRRITKTMALDAANRVAEKLFSERMQEAHTALRIRVEEIVNAHIPYPVRAIVKEYADWVSTTDSVCLYKNVDTPYGTRRSTYIDCKLSFWVSYPCGYLLVSEEEYDEVEKLKSKSLRIRNDRLSFEGRLADSIFALKTEKRIKESLPEILPYIDFPVAKQLPSPMFDDIRAQLRKLNK